MLYQDLEPGRGESGKVEGRGVREVGPELVPKEIGKLSWVCEGQQETRVGALVLMRLQHSEKDWQRARN